MKKKICKVCEKEFQPVKQFQPVCMENNFACAIEWPKIRARKKLEKSNRKDLKVYRQKSFPHQIKLTGIEFNRFIRTMAFAFFASKGYEPTCISCGKFKCGSGFDAGHAMSVRDAPELRFDPRNCYLQGRGCNRREDRKASNRAKVQKNYWANLRVIMGEDLVEWLRGPHKAKHYTCDDLITLRAMFAKETRYIDEHGQPSKDWRAI